MNKIQGKMKEKNKKKKKEKKNKGRETVNLKLSVFVFAPLSVRQLRCLRLTVPTSITIRTPRREPPVAPLLGGPTAITT